MALITNGNEHWNAGVEAFKTLHRSESKECKWRKKCVYLNLFDPRDAINATLLFIIHRYRILNDYSFVDLAAAAASLYYVEKVLCNRAPETKRKKKQQQKINFAFVWGILSFFSFLSFLSFRPIRIAAFTLKRHTQAVHVCLCVYNFIMNENLRMVYYAWNLCQKLSDSKIQRSIFLHLILMRDFVIFTVEFL